MFGCWHEPGGVLLEEAVRRLQELPPLATLAPVALAMAYTRFEALSEISESESCAKASRHSRKGLDRSKGGHDPIAWDTSERTDRLTEGLSWPHRSGRKLARRPSTLEQDSLTHRESLLTRNWPLGPASATVSSSATSSTSPSPPSGATPAAACAAISRSLRRWASPLLSPSSSEPPSPLKQEIRTVPRHERGAAHAPAARHGARDALAGTAPAAVWPFPAASRSRAETLEAIPGRKKARTSRSAAR